jgi:hypothetical protein
MQTLNTQFEHELKKILQQRMVAIAEILTAGQAVKDYASYMRYVGEFQALTQVVDTHCDEVNTTLNKR